MGKKGGGGDNSGFKIVKSSANSKQNKASKAGPQPPTGAAAPRGTLPPIKKMCNDGGKCPHRDCSYSHPNIMCPRDKDCDVESCPNRHMFRWVNGARMCAADRFCTAIHCYHEHSVEKCEDFFFCTIASCKFRHDRHRKVRMQKDKIHVGTYPTGEDNNVDQLRSFIEDRHEHQHGDVVDVTRNSSLLNTQLPHHNPEETIISIDGLACAERSTDGEQQLRETAMSCKLIDIVTQKSGDATGGAKKKVLSFTSYTLNVVDHGQLTPAALHRARKVHAPHFLNGRPVLLVGKTLSVMTDRVTSTIATTTYYDVDYTVQGTTTTVRVIGESADQPDEPLRITNVKLTALVDFEECSRIIQSSMATADTVTPTYALPSAEGGTAVETSLVLAGAVSVWCMGLQAPVQGKVDSVAASMDASLVVDGEVDLSISFRTPALNCEVLGRKLHLFAVNHFAKVCSEHTDPTRTARVRETVLPTADQLRQLQAIAGGMPESSTYKEVATRLDELGYAVEDVARSVGCNASVKHLRMSECPEGEEELPCTNPLCSFISLYNQFAVLDTIDPDSPAAAKRMALFNTLSPLDDLLVEWTTRHNSITVSKFKCNEAIVKCMSKLIPKTVVPVQAVVVRPPKDGYMTNDGTITAYVPSVTPPTCLKQPPVIITIPASCVRDKDGDRSPAFNTTTCAVGRTVLLMVSLDMMTKLTNGMTMPNDGSVTLVPEVPLSLVPTRFGDVVRRIHQPDTHRPQREEEDCTPNL